MPLHQEGIAMQDGHADARSDGYFSDFGSALRYWRTRRGYSQLRLAVDSSVSQRHLSFLESGRAQPSRDLVLKLGLVLDVPLRQRNAMLLAAGFAPAYQERNLSDPELSSVMQALDFMLRQQAPFPALVVDRLWNLVMFNEPAAGFMKWLLGLPPDAAIPRDGSINVLRLMLDPNGLRPRLVNWQAVCADSLLWIQREAMADGPGSEATVAGRAVRLAGDGRSVRWPLAEPRPPCTAVPAADDRARGCGTESVHDDHDAGHAARRHGARAAAGILFSGRWRDGDMVPRKFYSLTMLINSGDFL
jgi:transcriptional regulator with XRE-family HTH domain